MNIKEDTKTVWDLRLPCAGTPVPDDQEKKKNLYADRERKFNDIRTFFPRGVAYDSMCYRQGAAQIIGPAKAFEDLKKIIESKNLGTLTQDLEEPQD